MRATTAMAFALILVAGHAAADVRMSYTTPGGSTPQIAIKGNQVRMDGGAGARGMTLFDAESRRMTVIDRSSRRYYRMDAETMRRQGERMSAQMRQMREQMEQQLKNLPEAQREQMRAQMEQMMPQRSAADGDVELRFERTGEQDRVAGIRCEVTTVYRDGEPAQRVCIAPADSLGMTGADRASLRALYGFLQEMAGSFGGAHMGAQMPAQMMQDADGVPIRATDLDGQQSWALERIETGRIDADEFEVPAGYREAEPFSMGQ